MKSFAKKTRLHNLTLLMSLGFVAVKADVAIQTSQESLAGSEPTQSTEILLAKDKLRLDAHGAEDMTMIYRQDKKVFWMIQPKSMTYTEMTLQDLEKMAKALEAARAKMQEQMKNMPEEQRQMMEKMMGKMMAPPAPPKVTFKKGEGSGKVGTWSCRNWESYFDGVKSAEHCVADFKTTHLKQEDFAVFKDMAQFIGRVAPNYKGLMDQGIDLEKMGGIPVQTTVFEEGKADTRITLKSIERVDFKGDAYELPTGLTKKALPQMSPGLFK